MNDEQKTDQKVREVEIKPRTPGEVGTRLVSFAKPIQWPENDEDTDYD